MKPTGAVTLVALGVLLLAFCCVHSQAQEEDQTTPASVARTSHRGRQICKRFQPCRLTRCLPGYRRVSKRFRINGYYWPPRYCYDCGVCKRVKRIRRCPFSRCEPIERDCPKILRGPILSHNGKPCRGCPSCVKMCPNFACLVGPRPGCPRVIQGPLMKQDGIWCTGCPTCAEPCTDVPCNRKACRVPYPGDLVVRPGKDTCVGCDICLRVCPFRSCPRLPEDCKNVQPGPVIREGTFRRRPCLDCDRCVDKPEPCPIPICIALFCPDPKPGPPLPGRPDCPGCPICPSVLL